MAYPTIFTVFSPGNPMTDEEWKAKLLDIQKRLRDRPAKCGLSGS
jgi:hypothetical protein